MLYQIDLDVPKSLHNVSRLYSWSLSVVVEIINRWGSSEPCQVKIFLLSAWFLAVKLNTAMSLLSIYSFIPAAGKKKRYLIDKIYYGTPVSIAEQIYLLCGQQPPHRFLASILVPLFLKYWLTPGLESYLTNESMYGRRGREEEGRSPRG